MAKKNEIKKNEIVLTKENLLIQPLALTLIGANPSVIGNRVTLKIVKMMQNAFKEIISGRKSGKEWSDMSIFATEEVKSKYKYKEDLLFDIHVNELVTDRSCYRKAFNAACQLADIKVWVPTRLKDGSMAKARESLFTVILKDTQYQHKNEKTGEVTFGYQTRSHPIIGFRLKREVAEYIFSFQKRYGDFLDVPVFESNEKYFSPIYIFVSAHKYDRGGEFTVDFMEFRRILGFCDSEEDEEKDKGKTKEMKYKSFAIFYRSVVKPTEDALRKMAAENKIDFYFDVEKIYEGSKRAANPDKLKFIIHLSELGRNMKNDKTSLNELIGVEKRMKDEFGQTEAQIKSIMSKVPQNRMADLEVKLTQLQEMKESGKINVERNWSAYVNRSLCAWTEQFTAQQEIPFEETKQEASKASPAIEEPAVEEVDAVLAGMWENFLNQLSCDLASDLFDIWIEPLVPVSFENGLLSIRVPSSSFAELLNNNCYSKMLPAFHSVFGAEAAMRYVL